MSAISATAGAAQAPQPAGDPYRELTSGDFMELIFSELTNQDPLSPSDTNALLDQIATIRAIESDLELADTLGEVVKQNEIAASSSLVGKFATGLTASQSQAAGYVDAVRITGEGVILALSSGQEVALDQVTDIIDPAIIGFDDGVNDRPDAADDSAAVKRGEAVEIGVLANDSDDSGLDPSTVAVVDQPKHGAISIDKKTGVITYTHDGGPDSSDSFEYTVVDDEGLRSRSAVVNITISSTG